MKLESLKSKKISNMNKIMGGTHGIGDGTNTTIIKAKSATCSDGCVVTGNGTSMPTPSGGTWSYDF